MVYASSTTYLFTRLQKAFSNCESKEVYIIIMDDKYNFFIWNGLMVDILTGLGWCLCEIPEVGASVQTFL